MINVALADDHKLFREGLKRLLTEGSGDIKVGGEAASKEELVSLLKSQPFDVLVLDMSMPGTAGLETLRTVKQDFKSLPVLVLSMYPEEQYAVRALKAGANGYMTKECATSQLVEAIKTISQGERYITPTVANLLATEISRNSNGPLHNSLSNRELEVLLLLSDGLAMKEIAEHLSISVKTASTYRTRILEKLALSTNADLVHYVIENRLVRSA